MKKSQYSDAYQLFLTELRSARMAVGMTQVQLSEALEVDQPYVSRVESGSRRLDVVELHEWLQVLGVDWGEFMATLDSRWADARAARARLSRQAMASKTPRGRRPLKG